MAFRKGRFTRISSWENCCLFWGVLFSYIEIDINVVKKLCR